MRILLGPKETYMISHIVLKKDNVKADWRLHIQPKEKNNGRKVLVNEIYPSKESHIQVPVWKPGAETDKTPVLETGFGGVEVATFTHEAGQDCHKHFIGMEIYTVLEGTMRMEVDQTLVTLEAGDEIIVLPNTVHEVLPDGTPFLTRVHSINCYGDRDKYVDRNGEWCQVFTLKRLPDGFLQRMLKRISGWKQTRFRRASAA
jgi:quercetin dioxygenase-like cupin family protein